MSLLYDVMFQTVIFLISSYESSKRFTCNINCQKRVSLQIFVCFIFFLLEGINRWAGVGVKRTVKHNARNLSSNSGEAG